MKFFKKKLSLLPIKEKPTFSLEDLRDVNKLNNFPTDWSPQLAIITDEAFDDKDWIFETKYDGYSARAQIENGTCHLLSRSLNSFDHKIKELLEPLQSLKDDLILDGEIVLQDSKGRDKFQWLQNHDKEPAKGELKYFVFDILSFNGYDLRDLSLITRKKILKGILPKLKNVYFSEHIISGGKDYFASAQKNQLEGVIAKKLSSKYHEGTCSKDWLKVNVTCNKKWSSVDIPHLRAIQLEFAL